MAFKCSWMLGMIIFVLNWSHDLPLLQIWSSLTPDIQAYLKAELDFFDQLTNVSGKLYPVPKDERRSAAAELVRQVVPKTPCGTKFLEFAGRDIMRSPCP